jgi:hypothetical protein
MLATVKSMSRRRASSVAQAMCGVIRQLGAASSGFFRSRDGSMTYSTRDGGRETPGRSEADGT